MSYLGALAALNGVASGLYLGQETGYVAKGTAAVTAPRVLTGAADMPPPGTNTATHSDTRNTVNVQWAVLVLAAVILYAGMNKCKKR